MIKLHRQFVSRNCHFSDFIDYYFVSTFKVISDSAENCRDDENIILFTVFANTYIRFFTSDEYRSEIAFYLAIYIILLAYIFDFKDETQSLNQQNQIFHDK